MDDTALLAKLLVFAAKEGFEPKIVFSGQFTKDELAHMQNLYIEGKQDE